MEATGGTLRADITDFCQKLQHCNLFPVFQWLFVASFATVGRLRLRNRNQLGIFAAQRMEATLFRSGKLQNRNKWLVRRWSPAGIRNRAEFQERVDSRFVIGAS